MDAKEIEHLAALGYLADGDISAGEMEEIILLMNAVLDFPVRPSEERKAMGVESLRPDTAAPSFPRERMLENAKEADEAAFLVPRMV
ncbi:MAG TPA: hypothetical protein H9668_03865 [Firmicutes bacterium]|nr:hypothetical protein [Bacillota bacterium]